MPEGVDSSGLIWRRLDLNNHKRWFRVDFTIFTWKHLMLTPFQKTIRFQKNLLFEPETRFLKFLTFHMLN